MTEKELTKKILRNAKQQAQDLITAAEQRATEQITHARAQAEVRRAKALAKGEADLTYRKTQQQRAQEVARIKAQINAQQVWIDRAFQQARTKLINANQQTIKTLVTNLTQKYAQPGDTITIAKNWSAALPELPTTPTIAGGIIIENKTYRLELDVDSILAELREQVAPTVAEILGVN